MLFTELRHTRREDLRRELMIAVELGASVARRGAFS
jgi:hypothetical protein